MHVDPATLMCRLWRPNNPHLASGATLRPGKGECTRAAGMHAQSHKIMVLALFSLHSLRAPGLVLGYRCSTPTATSHVHALTRTTRAPLRTPS